MGHIPFQRLCRANVVVNDLRATARNYARMLGVTQWAVRNWTPDRLSHSQAYGYRAHFGYVTATGASSQGITFRLIQPTHGFSTFTEHLITHGEGVHSICATTLEPQTLQELTALEELTVAQATAFPDGSTSVLFDTRQALGGFYVEVQSATTLPQPPDEVWDLSNDDQRPDAVAWLTRIPKIGHFGVAVSSVMDKLPGYASLLGVERWTGVHFRTAPGSLERSTFKGQKVDNAWLLAITDVADFALELLQGTREPTDCRQTVDRIGEGIHHILVRRDLSDAEGRALHAWMESMQIGVVMSGVVRAGAAEFFYFDTRAALGGYLLEVIVYHTLPEPPGDTNPVGRFELDFTTRGDLSR